MSVFFYKEENVVWVREDHPMIDWLITEKWINMAHIHCTSLYSFGFVKVYPTTFERVEAKYLKSKTPEK